MAELYKDGEVIDITLEEDVAAGDVIPLGGMCAVAILGGSTGDTIPAHLEKVWIVDCKSDDAIAIGDLLYWDNTNKELTKTETNNTRFGRAVSAAGDGVTTVKAKLGAA